MTVKILVTSKDGKYTEYILSPRVLVNCIKVYIIENMCVL